ncbi:MAG: DUF1127 domain-containing protein [Silicimonas sp.]
MTDQSICTNRAATSGHPLFDLANRVSERLLKARRRKGFNRLLDLDDHILDDIGVLRHEVEHASRLPLSVDAATELRRMSLERRRKRM